MNNLKAMREGIITYLKLWEVLPHKKLDKARNNARLNNFLNWGTTLWF